MRYYFFDTSALFGSYRKEQHTNKMGNLIWDAYFESSGGEPSFGVNNFIVSHLLSYEMVTKLISKNKTQETLSNINKFLVEYNNFIKIEVTKSILQNSIILMEKYTLLRSYDAIQLACALEAKNRYDEMVFVSNDENLIKAARTEMLRVNEDLGDR